MAYNHRARAGADAEKGGSNAAIIEIGALASASSSQRRRICALPKAAAKFLRADINRENGTGRPLKQLSGDWLKSNIF